MNIFSVQRTKDAIVRDNLELVGAAAFLLLALLVFFWPAVFGGRVLLPADLIFNLDPLWQPLAPEGYSDPSNSLLADQVYQFYPWEAFARRSLAKGRLPLWNPYTDGGTPFIGNAQSAIFSPFHLVGYLFSLHSSLVVGAFLRLFVAGTFTFLFAREVGINFFGALLAMVAFTFSGPMIMWLGHPHSLVIAWLPMILFTTERVLTRRRKKYVAFGALTIGAQFLGGHPETSFHVMLAWAAYVLYRVVSLEKWHPPQWLPHLARIGATALSGVLIAAVQLLPFAEALWHSATLSARASRASDPTSSLSARFLFDWHEWPTIITTLLPNYFGTPLNDSYWFPYSNYVEQNAYVGVLPLMLASLVILRNVSPSLSRPNKRNWVLLFGSMAFVSLGVALHFPVLNVINALPLFSLMANERLRLVYALAMAILAGLGMDVVTSNAARKFRRSATRFLGVLALGSIILITVTFVGLIVFKDKVIQSGQGFMEANWNTTPYLSRSLDYYYDLVEGRYQKKLDLFHPNNIVMYIPVLITFVWGVIGWWERKANVRGKMWHWIILLLTIFDLFLTGMPFNPNLASQHVFPTPEAIRFLHQDPGMYRVSGTDLTLYPNSGMLFNLHDIRGYDTIVSHRYVNLIDRLEGHYRFHFHSLFRRADSPLWDLLNVKYVLTDQNLEGKWEIVYQNEGNLKVYRNRDVLPRAFMVHRAIIVDNPDQSLKRILDPAFDLGKNVMLEKRPAGWSDSPAQFTPADSTRIVTYRPNYIKVNVRTTSKGLLVLTDTYAPGWKACVDGHPVPVYIANHAFRAVVVPNGHHQVEFVYRPWSFYVGAILSLFTLITISVFLVLSMRTR